MALCPLVEVGGKDLVIEEIALWRVRLLDCLAGLQTGVVFLPRSDSSAMLTKGIRYSAKTPAWSSYPSPQWPLMVGSQRSAEASAVVILGHRIMSQRVGLCPGQPLRARR